MIRALIRTTTADLLHHRVQSLLIVLLLSLATTSLTLGVSVYQATNDPFARFMRETNGAHLWLTADPGIDLSSVASEDGVAESAGPFAKATASFPIPADAPQDGPGAMREPPPMDLLALPATMPSVGQPILTDGRWMTEPGEIVVSSMFARFDRYQLGDEFTVLGADGPTTLRIVGFAELPAMWELMGDGIGIGPYGFVLEETLDQVVPDRTTWQSMLALRLEDSGSSGSFGGTVLDQFAANGISSGIVVQDWQVLRHEFTEDNQINALVLSVFSIFALIASALVIANTVGGRVIAQMREIGLLKSVGFTPRGIVTLFLVEHILLGVGAVAIGLLAGSALTPLFDDQVPLLLTNTPSPLRDPTVVAIVVLVALFTVVLCTLGPSLSAARVDSIRAMTQGPIRRSQLASMVAGLAMRFKFPVVISLGLNAVFARPLRSVFTIVALALTIITVTFSLGMEATLRDIINHPERWGSPFALEIRPQGASAAEIEAALKAEPAVIGYSTRREIDARVEGESTTISAYAIGGDLSVFEKSIVEGRLIAAPGEALVGQALLDLTGKQIGDSLKLFTDQGPVDITIVGRIIAPDARGKFAIFSLDTYRAAVGSTVDPGDYAVRLRDDADRFQVADTLTQSLGGQADVDPDQLADSSDMNEIRSILFTLDTILVIIGVVNVLTTTMLGVRERIREVGMLKALGCSPMQTMASIMSGVGVLAIIAALVGLPLGLVATRLLFNELGHRLGIGSGLGVMPGGLSLGIVFILSIVVVFVGGLLPARNASMIRVSNALRHE